MWASKLLGITGGERCRESIGEEVGEKPGSRQQISLHPMGTIVFFWSCIQEIKPLLPSLLISLLLSQEKALSQSMCNKHRRGRQTVQCPLRLSFSIGRKFSGTIDNELFWLLGWWKIYWSPWKWPVVRENEGSSDLRKRMKRLGMSGVAGSSDNNLLTCLKLKLKL